MQLAGFVILVVVNSYLGDKKSARNAILRNAKAGGCAGKKQMKTLFDRPVAKDKDPLTSHKAGEEFRKSGKAEKHYKKIMNFLRKNSGSTGHEIAAKISLTHVQVMRRMSELRAKGEVINCKNCQLNLYRCKGGDCAYPIIKGKEVTWWIK